MDYLKIPREFVQDIVESERTLAVVRGVVALGEALGLAVVAEGVETIEQQHLIADAGAMFGQGYLFDRPLSVQRFRERAANRLVSLSPQQEGALLTIGTPKDNLAA